MTKPFQTKHGVPHLFASSSARRKSRFRHRMTLSLAEGRASFIDSEANGVEDEGGVEKELLGELYSIVETVREIIDSDVLAFSVYKVAKHYEVWCTLPVLAMLRKKQAALRIQTHFSQHQFDPHFGLYDECVVADPNSDLSSLRSHFATIEEAAARADLLNAIIGDLRSRGRSDKFEAACRNFRRSSDKNNRELLSYVKQHSETTDLLVCRCEVGVMKAARFFQASRVQQLEALRKARKALFDFIKVKFGDHFLGFAWKLGFGHKRRFYFHLVLFFNGGNLKSDIPIVRKIGEHWKKAIMAGEGTYYNCNACKGGYKVCGIGQYSKNDATGKWKGIVLMCAYLTKPDDLVRLQIKGVRTFGKGNVPKAEKRPA